jgi:hypothetical protein
MGNVESTFLSKVLIVDSGNNDSNKLNEVTQIFKPNPTQPNPTQNNLTNLSCALLITQLNIWKQVRCQNQYRIEHLTMTHIIISASS